MRKLVAFVAVFALATVASAATIDIDVTGINSWDSQSDASNEWTAVGAGHTVIGIGWTDVGLETVGGSYLSEATMGLESQINLRVGAADAFPGTGVYSSGGILYFSDLGLPDIVVTGDLDIEFFEGYDDVSDAIDCFYTGGFVTLEYIPEPAGLALLGLGALVLRRR